MQAPSAHCAQSGSAVRSAPFAVAERTTRSPAGTLRPLVHVNLDAYCAKLTGCHPGVGPRSTEMLALLKAMPQNTCSSALDDMPHSPRTRLLGENRYLLSNSARRANRPDYLQRKRPITLATFSASSQLPWPLGARIWRAHRNVRTFDSAPPAGALRRGCQRTR